MHFTALDDAVKLVTAILGDRRECIKGETVLTSPLRRSCGIGDGKARGGRDSQSGCGRWLGLSARGLSHVGHAVSRRSDQ